MSSQTIHRSDTEQGLTPIPYVDLATQFALERDTLMPIIEKSLASGMWVGGPAVDQLEAEIAAYIGVRHCVSVNSGTDALMLGLMGLGVRPGDEVITPPNSFIASTGCVAHIRAKPVFIDVAEDQNLDPSLLEGLITEKTKAIMPVHLTGRVCDMDPINEIAQRYGIGVIEDAAQAIGSEYKGRKAGALADVGCFSTHPLKNLNACGDGGLLTTDNDEIADLARRVRNHGLVDRDTAETFGVVSRMDTIQAEILRYRLGRLSEVIARRRENAAFYKERLRDNPHVFFPQDSQHQFNTYVLFVGQFEQRDALQRYLGEYEIGTKVHYPVPIHLQPAAVQWSYKKGDFPMTDRQSETILSLPNYPHLSPEKIAYICDKITAFYETR